MRMSHLLEETSHCAEHKELEVIAESADAEDGLGGFVNVDLAEEGEEDVEDGDWIRL